MKLSILVPLSFRIFLLSVCLHVVISCKDEATNATKEQVISPVQEETSKPLHEVEASPTQEETISPVQEVEASPTQEETITPVQDKAVNTDKGIAYFESGIEAANSNNMPLAFKDFLAGAKEGHIYAQYNVGLMYEQGLGISKNAKEAVYWYMQSAMQGNSAAQFNLGVCFENGIGTSVDFKKANEWYRKASAQGDGLAVGNLGMLYIRGQGVKENKIAGMALLLMSTTMDKSPENQAKNNISKTSGLTVAMVTEAQNLSDQMIETNNILQPLDNYLKASE